MDYTIRFTTTPKACRACDQWDPRRRQCKREQCRYNAADLKDREGREVRAEERRAAPATLMRNCAWL